MAEFLDESAYDPSYIFKKPSFFSEAGLSSYNPPSSAVKVVGPFRPDGGELEAELDIQYAMSTARGANFVYWTTTRYVRETGLTVRRRRERYRLRDEAFTPTREVIDSIISYAHPRTHRAMRLDFVYDQGIHAYAQWYAPPHYEIISGLNLPLPLPLHHPQSPPTAGCTSSPRIFLAGATSTPPTSTLFP